MKIDKKQYDKIIKEIQQNWGWGLLCFAVLMIGFITLHARISDIPEMTINNHYKNGINYTEFADILAKNCNGTYLTKKYGESRWSVFITVTKEDGFHKNIYTPLEECFEGVKNE